MPDFLTVENNPIEAVQRATQQRILPNSVTPDKFTDEWIKFDNPIASLFAGAKTFAGAEQEAPDGVTLNPNFQIGNAGIIARYRKRGHLVSIYVRFTIGSTTVVNNIAENGSGQHQGNMSAMIVDLPFPGAAQQPYAIGTLLSTYTTQDVSNALTHGSFGGELALMELVPGARFAYIARDSTDFTWSTDPIAPAAYNANGFHYWSAGDYFEYQLEYETDYD